ncbi:uncharacterized protein G2W53_016028 [Senna tora]|uniref:Uncharacterized protein n=1 Tax=Senna tora TaxID=362788 RepID=A0A834WWM7_9FABA|nr:uncharacterized protein G2W53_016028 [Senna tora]
MRLPEEEHLNHSNLSQIGYSLRSTESPEIDRRMPPSSPADRVIDHLRRRRRCRRSSAHGVICSPSHKFHTPLRRGRERQQNNNDKGTPSRIVDNVAMKNNNSSSSFHSQTLNFTPIQTITH